MKRFVISALVGIALSVASYGVYETQSRDNTLSDIMLANVEALSTYEWKSGDKIDCYSFITSPKPEEYLEDPSIFPVVVDCEPCGNLVIGKEMSGLKKCTYY